MDEVLLRETYRGYVVEVLPDGDAENPLLDEPGVSLVSWHRKYGGRHGFGAPDELLEYARENGAETVCVYAYDHNRVRFSTSRDSAPFNDRWDAGWFGFLLFERRHLDTLVPGSWDDVPPPERARTLRAAADRLLVEYEAWANDEYCRWRCSSERVCPDCGETRSVGVAGRGGFFSVDSARADARRSVDALISAGKAG